MLSRRWAAVSQIASALALVGCGEPHREVAQKYLAMAQGVLIAKGVCSDVLDCQRKELLYWEGGEISLGFIQRGGAYVSLYKTQNPELVDAIAARFSEAHAPQTVPQVTLTAYSNRHDGSKVLFRRIVFK